MPEDTIIVILVEGGCVQTVYANHDQQNIRVIVVDYDDMSTDTEIRGDNCDVFEMDLTEDDDYIAAVMEVL